MSQGMVGRNSAARIWLALTRAVRSSSMKQQTRDVEGIKEMAKGAYTSRMNISSSIPTVDIMIKHLAVASRGSIDNHDCNVLPVRVSCGKIEPDD